MNPLTAAQLRRKRRDKAWRQWITKHENYSRKLESILRKYFADQHQRVLSVLKSFGLRAQLVDEDGNELPDIDINHLQVELQEQIDDSNDDWEESLLLLLLLIAGGFTTMTVQDLGYALDDLEQTVKPAGTVPIPAETSNWTKEFLATALVLIGTTTLKKIVETVRTAQEQGKSASQAITTINEAYERYAKTRSASIASDWAGKVASMTQQLAVASLGIPSQDLRQTWVSMRDARVRDSHQELDGQTRRFGEEFKPGLKFPRDPDAPIEETAHCRCWLVIDQVKQGKSKAA